MSNDFLSQDEVDALLKGVSGEEDAPAEPEAPSSSPRPYNLANQERIVRGRMPTLESINDRFARLARGAVFNFMRKSPEISAGPIRVIKYAEFIRNLAVPTNLNLVSMKPLRGNGLVVMDPKLVFSVVDNLFGGDGRFHTRIEGREFTATETGIIMRLLEVILAEYRRAWAPVQEMGFEYVRSEMHTQFANIATPNEIVLVTTFNVDLGSGGGDIHFCLPYASVEPIRDKLFNAISGEGGEGADGRWVNMLKQQIQEAEIELMARLTEIPLTVRDLLAMRPGDVISFDLPKRVVAEADGVALFECRYGTLNNNYALKVDRVVASRLQPGGTDV